MRKLLLAVLATALAVHAQRAPSDLSSGSRKLHGRFLHITDIHPDTFYTPDSDPDEKCHRGHGDCGYFGAETTGCDSPFSLVNTTLQWIDQNLKDKIDFVVWTGDTARHDNDHDLPRTATQIYDLNRRVVSQMVDVFKKPNADPDAATVDLTVPIVPNLGNNDIFPHNIMTAGPSRTLIEYASIWKDFIPEDQFHVFDRGGYFWSQVVPGVNGYGGLAVFSLNTLYFYDSNKAVDGCDKSGEPGTKQMEWLGVQLQMMRERGMKAMFIGHVPPTWVSAKMNWDETCWRKYVTWSRQFRDVIVGSVFGHMNLDHFILLDGDEKKPIGGGKGEKSSIGKRDQSYLGSLVSSVFDYGDDAVAKEADTCTPAEFEPEDHPTLSVSSAENYLWSLREQFSHLPPAKAHGFVKNPKHDIGGKWAERYVLTHISPSVIPNYFPTLRVIEYNITGLVDEKGFLLQQQSEPDGLDLLKKGKKKHPKKPEPIPDPPSDTAPPGPAYSPQTWTWQGYTQYYLNLTKYNAEHSRHTFAELGAGEMGSGELKRREEKLEYEVEYDTRTDKAYRLKDMTVKNYLKLARKIVDAQANVKDEVDDLEDVSEDLEEDESGDDDDDVSASKKHKKKKKHKHKHDRNKKRDAVWHAFVKRAFVGTLEDEEVGEFQVQREQCLKRAKKQ